VRKSTKRVERRADTPVLPRLSKKRVKHAPDWWLFITTLVLVCVGIIMVFSSSQYFAQYKPYYDTYYFLKRQIINVCIGFVAMLIMYKLDYRIYKKLAWPAALVVGALLLMVLFTEHGDESGGAMRWLELGPIRFQPSEFAKIVLVLLTAKIISQNQPYIKSFARGCLPPLFLMGVSCALVFAQNDLGTCLVLAGSIFVMMFCGGIRMGYILGLGGAGIGLAVFAITSTSFRMDRITYWLDPWADPLDGGFQIIQSWLAIGSGGLTGMGLGSGSSKWFYLPARHTDFIFAVLAEETGFLGASFVICLFIILVWRGLTIAARVEDVFGSCLAIGITAMIGLQAFLNLAVVTGLFPITGITLPFISYGGTSLIISMAAIGLLLNISRFAEAKK